MALRVSTRVFTNPIAKWRVQNCLSQKKLAEVLGVHPQTVARWEAGAIPNSTYLLKLSGLLLEEPSVIKAMLKGEDND